jgi:hypothetical protein
MATPYYPKTNEIVLDMTTKDYIKVTNGIPVKDDQGRETRALHPTEGIVFRHIPGEGLYWSYISIEGHRLSPCRVTETEWAETLTQTKGRI